MATRLTTCNVNNLFVRYKFGGAFPGAPPGSGEEAVPVADDRRGFLPLYNEGAFEIFGPQQRDFTAQAIRASAGGTYPEILCLQEVESLLALREFNLQHLDGNYPNAIVIDSRDLRQIDVALLTATPILGIRSHVDELATGDAAALVSPDRPQLFSRDCLEVDLDLGDGSVLTVLLNHLKSQFVDVRHIRDREERKREEERQTERNDALRKAQAARVAEIVAAAADRPVCVVGDLNQLPGHDSIAPLYDHPDLFDALTMLPPEERWTHWYRGENTVGQLDHLLLTPALAERCQSPPTIERRGISFERILQDGGVGPRQTRLEAADGTLTPVDFRFERFEGVGPKAFASDHCPITLRID
jgi:endonuclease/exonuclease/phosphatase family metal-dependent hydrolase